MSKDAFDLDSILADFHNDLFSSDDSASLGEEEPQDAVTVGSESFTVPSAYSDAQQPGEAYPETEVSFDEPETYNEEPQQDSAENIEEEELRPIRRRRMKKRTKRALTTAVLCALVLLIASVLLWGVLNIGTSKQPSGSAVAADLSAPVIESVLKLEDVVTGSAES